MSGFNRSEFVEVCQSSGLTMSELADIYGVTRQTIYNWKSATTPTQGLIARLAGAYTAGLLAAVKRGVLPMPTDTAREIRAQRIRRMSLALHQSAQKTIGG